MKQLTKIANKHLTDKGTTHAEAHGYTETYHDYISSTKEIVLLEIGILNGASLRMWREYNPNMKIFAIDINPNCVNLVHKNDYTKIFIGDATDSEFLSKVVNEIGKIDVIIDDGSHVKDHILKSFDFLYNHLSENGVYFIEDLHVHHNNFPEFISDFNELLKTKKIPKDYKITNHDKLLKIDKQLPIKNEKTLFVVSTHPMSDYQTELTIECLKYLKRSNIDILVTSHAPLSKEIMDICDYHVYDKNNILCDLSSNYIEWFDYENFYCEINAKHQSNIDHNYHGPAVYSNFYNGIQMANALGYETAICLNYDLLLTPEFIDSLIDLYDQNSGLFFEENDFYLTTLFVINTKFYAEVFEKIKYSNEYDLLAYKHNSNKVLEVLYRTVLKNHTNLLKIKSRLFLNDLINSTNSKIDVVSRFHRVSVLPIKNNPNQFAIVWTNANKLNTEEFDNIRIYINDNLFINKQIIPYFEYVILPFNNEEINIDIKLTDPKNNVIHQHLTYKIDEYFMKNVIQTLGFIDLK